MLPPNFQPPVPGFPVAQLTIDGLGICCFNDGSTNGGAKLWEVAYLRGMSHDLVIAIEELDEQGETVNVTPYLIDDDVRSFTISLTGGSEAHYEVYPEGGPYDPNFTRNGANNDPHDLGWIIDITGPEPQHNFKNLLPGSQTNVAVTLAQFRNAFFYTRKPGDQPVVFSPIEDKSPLSQNSIELGRANEEVDGLLLANVAGEITFEFDPVSSYSINPLPYDLNRPLRYRISVINEDAQLGQAKSGFVKGDFHLFYDVMEVDGVKKDMWARPRPTSPGNPSDGDCNVGGAASQKSLGILIS